MGDAPPDPLSSFVVLLDEILDGPAPDGAFVLNPGDQGLLRSLDALGAEAASAVPASGGASIAAHVDHLRYGLELLNRWSGGEEPFDRADYSASWHRTRVSEAEWAALRGRLRDEAHRWRVAIGRRRARTAAEQTGALGSVVHLAYHLGAIRQIDRALKGPEARD
jgi:hypothetical protein